MVWPFKKKSPQPAGATSYIDSEQPQVSYWTYFGCEPDARDAAQQFRANGLAAEVQQSAANEGSWLVLACIPLPGSEDVVQRYSEVVKGVVAGLNGEYDGWEAGPLPDEETAERIRDWLNAGVGAA